MKKKILFWAFWSATLVAGAQTTLEACLSACAEHYPLVRQLDLLRQASDMTLQNAAKAWWPQVLAQADASYQTQVTKLGISVPGVSVPSIDRDREGIVVQVEQTLWDGGRIRSQRHAVRTQLAAQEAEVAIGLYELRSKVVNLYFAALLLDEQLQLNGLLQEQLSRDHERVIAAERKGVATGADVDAVRLHQLTTQQQRTSLLVQRETYVRMLAALCGLTLKADEPLAKPADVPVVSVSRPEYAFYSAQAAQLAAQREGLRAQLLPRLGAFVQGGYGKPGLNMLNNKFEPYAMGGLRLSWSLSPFYTRKNDLRKLEVSEQMIAVNRSIFERNQSIEIARQSGEAKRFALLAQQDEEIIRLRQNIAESARIALEQGTLDGTQYINRLTDEYLARQQQAVHRMQQLSSLFLLNHAKGQ